MIFKNRYQLNVKMFYCETNIELDNDGMATYPMTFFMSYV